MRIYGHRGVGRHKQETPARDLKCPECLKDNCFKCSDVLLARVGRSIGCTCTRSGHSQILRDARLGAQG